ncbi:MAG: hypothetical protein HY722_01215 [Planctomycetes bacterium]|nr:hypothetical protein [Planctomycetota bacterium]
MRTFAMMALGLAAGLALSLGVARAQDDGHHHGKGPGRGDEPARTATGEVRVYLLDGHKQPVSIEGMSATITLELAGGARKTVNLAPARGDLDHGQTLPLGEQFVSLVVKKPHAHGEEGDDEHGEEGHEEHGEGHGEEGHEGHGEGHGEEGHGEHGAEVAFFQGDIPMDAYACPMCDVMTEGPGDCPKCHMAMKKGPISFNAVVVLRGRDGRSRNVRGFKYPTMLAPTSLAEAIEQLDAVAAAVDEKVGAGSLDEVHLAAEHLTVIGETLPGLVAVASRHKADALGQKLRTHFDELDEAGDAGDAAKTRAALDRLRATITEIKRLGR